VINFKTDSVDSDCECLRNGTARYSTWQEDAAFFTSLVLLGSVFVGSVYLVIRFLPVISSALRSVL